MSDYTLSFSEAVKAMDEGLEVLCEGESGTYKMDKDGTILHHCGSAGYVEACIMGKKGSKKWKVLEISRYI